MFLLFPFLSSSRPFFILPPTLLYFDANVDLPHRRQKYLERADVRAAMNVLPSTPVFGANSTEVEQSLIPDLNAPTSLPLWADIVANVPVLVYQGQFDLICNL